MTSYRPFQRLTAVFAALLLSMLGARADENSFPLGQSARSGAVCIAQVVHDDPAAQIPFAKAWSIACRGWDATLGHLYQFPGAVDGDLAHATPAIWRAALAERATCKPSVATPLPGLSGAIHSVCMPKGGKPLYSVYVARSASGLVIAEGFEPLDELVRVGLQVVAGVAAAPSSAVQTQTASAFSVSDAGSLSQAIALAQQAPGWLRERAFTENQGWRFSDAERDFRLLASDTSISRRDRAYIELNWALNVSNEGRADEAQSLFAKALSDAAGMQDSELDMVALNYRALDALNRVKFTEAEQLARQALAVRGAALPAQAAAEPTTAGGALEIDSALAASLNRLTRASGFRTAALSGAQRRQILQAQAYFIIGCAQAGGSSHDAARASFNQAQTLLGNQNAVWLRAQIALQLVRLDLGEHHSDQAQVRLAQTVALFQSQQYLTASPAEASLYMALARTEAEGGQADRALQDYATGMELFRQTRGTLGDSANDAAPYFDLLVAKARSGGADAARYQSLFFDAAQSVVGLTAARTVARLAARVAQGDSGSASLARALEDAQRQLTVKSAQVQHARTAPGYSAAQGAADEVDLARIASEVQALQQQLLAANPRYGQLVASAATLADLQKALRPGEVYVKTILLTKGGYVIAVTPATVDIYAIALSRSQAGDIVSKLRKPFDSVNFVSRFDVEGSHALFATIFGPVMAKVVAAKSLIYEPDGPLVSLPASVFVVDDASVATYKARLLEFQKNRNIDLYGGLAWLGRNTDVSLSVSATGFLQSRAFPASRASRAFLGFGAPSLRDVRDPNVFSLVTNGREGAAGITCSQVRLQMIGQLGSAIPGIDRTIRQIGSGLGAGQNDLVLGAAFTDTDAARRTDLNNYRIVFFGTHGLLPDGDACLPEPALVTSMGQGSSDALLDASEILNLKLDADLVVLSACNTGGVGSASEDRTGLAGSGEALGGLARDFIYAGSRGLIVSQWDVDTGATLELMTRLFSPGASSQGDALRHAELAMMDNKVFSHPFYWAGFSLVGDGTRAMPAGQGR